MNSQILPDMLINFALINITDRKNEGTNTIDGNWQADEGRRYRDNVRIYLSLFRILCKYLFSEVAVQAVTELDNKAAHCHTPVPQWHRPFL